MKKILLLIAFVYGVYAQQNNSELNSLIANEYRFASKASQVGTRESFSEFIADDGILFRPAPVNGKKYLAESKPSSGCLLWYPTDAAVSRAGDLGFTTGPWEWRKNKSDNEATAFGNFCTVWQRQPDNSWKFLIDIGSSNPKPDQAPVPLKFDASDTSLTQRLIRGERHSKAEELSDLDKQFSTIAEKMGVSYAVLTGSSRRPVPTACDCLSV